MLLIIWCEHALTVCVKQGLNMSSQPSLAKHVENIDAHVMHAKSTVPLTAVRRPISYNLEKHSLAA